MAVAQDLERYLIRIDATTEQLRRELRLADSAVASTARNVDNSTNRIASSFESINKRLANTRNLVGGIALGAAAREVIQYADTWRQLEGRLKIIHRDMGDVEDAQEALFDVAQRSRAPLEATTQLYTRLNQALSDNQRAQFDVLGITETFGKALAITGEGASQAQSAILQFTQAVQSDFKASAQEINSLQDSAPRVAMALRQALETGGKSLKQMAADGELSTEKVLTALQRISPVIEEEFSNIGTTVGGAFTRLDNAFLKYLGQNDLVSEGTSSLAAGINYLADNFDVLANVAVGAALIFAGRLAPALLETSILYARNTQQAIAYQLALARMAGIGTGAAVSMTALNGAMAFFGGPIGLAITAVAGGVYLLSQRLNESTTATARNSEAIDVLQKARDQLNGKSEDLTQKIKADTEEKIRNTEATLRAAEAEIKLLEARLANPTYGAYASAKAGIDLRGATSDELELNREQVELLRKGIAQTKKDLEDFLKNGGKPKGSTGGGGGLSKEMEKLVKKQAEWSAELKTSIEQAQRLNEASRESEDAYKAVARQIEVENELREKGYKIGSKVYEARKAELTQLKELEAQTETNLDKMRDEQKKREELASEQARQFAQPFENAAENIQNAMSDTFEGIFDGSIDSAGDAADAIKRIFLRLAAEMATLAIFRPSVMGAGGIGAIGTAIFGGAGTGAAGGAGSGSAGSMGGLGDLSSLGGFLANGTLYSSTLGGFGTNLGNVLAGGSWGQYGPWMQGSIQDVMGGAFGNMGYGVIGSLAANLLGLGGGVGGMVGGTLGTLAGGAIGTSLGTILGLPGGPLGAIAGSFIGSALGGLFGGKSVPSRYVGAYVGVDDKGKFTPGAFGSDEATKEQVDAYKQLQESAATGLNNLADMLGVTIKGAPKLQFSTSGKRDGGKIRVGIQGLGNDVLGAGINDMLTQEGFTDGEAALQYALRMVMANADFEGVSAKMETYYKKAFTANDTVEAALEDIAKVKALFAETETPLTAAEEAMKALNDAFDGYKDTAEKLKFTVEDLAFVESERQKRIEELRDGYNDEVMNQIRSIVDPVGLAVEQEMKRYQAQMKEAQTIGADTAAVETLHQLQLQAIYGQQAAEVAKMAENFQRLSNQLKQTKDDLLIGTLSTLNPQQQYDMLAAKFSDIGNRARLGDIEALSELNGISKQFLEASRAMFGSSTEYADDFSHVLDIIDLAKDTSDRQVEIQQGILEGQQEIVDTMTMLGEIIAAGGNAQAGLLVEVNQKLALLNDRLGRAQAA